MPQKLFCYDRDPATQPEGVKHGVVFASPVASCLRYTSVALQGLLRAGYESKYCYFINTTGAVGLQIYHCPVTEAGSAKTMTSLLILPALLVKVLLIKQELSGEYNAFLFFILEMYLPF